jgi:hypothetical protein
VSEAFATTRHFQRLCGRSFRPPQDGATAIKVWIYPPGPYGASINRAPALWRDKLASVYRLYEDMGLARGSFLPTTTKVSLEKSALLGCRAYIYALRLLLLLWPFSPKKACLSHGLQFSQSKTQIVQHVFLHQEPCLPRPGHWFGLGRYRSVHFWQGTHHPLLVGRSNCMPHTSKISH